MAYQFMPMYNVNWPVGDGETNLKDDVLLVQLMLTEFAAVAPMFANTLPRDATIRPDGNYTPTLGQWIRAFQQQTSGGVAPDGKILPLQEQDGHFVPMLGGRTATLALLNYNLLRSAPWAHRHIAERMQLKIQTGF